MSTVFDLDTDGQRVMAELAAANAAPFDPRAGFFHGIPTGIGAGVMRGGARAAQAISMAGGALVSTFSSPELTDRYFREVDDYVNNAVDYWTPRAETVGTAGRVLGGLSEIAFPLMAGGGNPALLIASQEMGGATDLVREGVPADAAVGVGAIQGLATGLGFKIPFLGKTLASRMASGVAGNLGVNTGATAASHEVLQAAGQEQAAKQFNPADPEARAVDLLTGLAFGALAHKLTPTEVAASATLANAKHFQEDTAPGIPADINASVAHQKAMDAATLALLKGEPVVAPEAVTRANFVPRETSTQEIPSIREFLKDLEAGPEPTPELSPEEFAAQTGMSDQAIEARFRRQIETNPEAAQEAYARIPESEGGRILNTGLARELSPDYLADRTRSAAVHEPASELVKTMYARKLAQAPQAGQEPLVIFSAGGTGAGKTKGLSVLPEAPKAQIIYDTNMNKLSSAVSKIDQALAAGKRVEIAYTYREPMEALTGGALPRAMRQEVQHGSGRTVPIREHINTHLGSRDVIEQIAAHYAGDKRVLLRVIDNSHGKGGARLTALSEIPKMGPETYNSLHGQALKALETERTAGRISESVYRGFAGAGADVLRAESQPGVGGSRGPRGSGDRGQSEPASAGGRVEPIVAAARQLAAESNLQIPTGEIDAQGNPVTRNAREVLAEAEAGIAQAEVEGKGIMAAVNCFLQRGP